MRGEGAAAGTIQESFTRDRIGTCARAEQVNVSNYTLTFTFRYAVARGENSGREFSDEEILRPPFDSYSFSR